MAELDRDYMAALQAHVAEASEDSLSQAYELGRRTLAEGLGVLDVVSLHEQIVRALLSPMSSANELSTAQAVSNFLREFLSPFEMMFRGYKDANRELQRLNEQLRAANRELLEKQAQLIQSAKMASLGELVAGVAHEINNPLAFVKSHVSTAQASLGKVSKEVGEIASQEAQQHLERAHSRLHETGLGLARIEELVLKLRAFSRLDEGEHKRVSIRECVESVLTILQHRCQGRIELETHFGHPDVIECFPSLLNQAILNIVSNAIDAIEEQGTICISTGADADGYAIFIADTGRGIPERLRERVFEPFFTTKAVGQGTGLGLSITYSIIERHGGSLTLSPRAGGGTVVTIRLPLGAC